MNADAINEMRSVEDHHWWYQVLRDLVTRELTKLLPEGGRVLDAGCGTGGMLDQLSKRWDACGIDISDTAVEHCLKRGLPQVKQASIHHTGMMTESLDAVISLDVLYHQSVTETDAMSEMARILRPGGWLVLNLAAWDELKGAHDVAVCGGRRYTPNQVTQLAKQAGIVVNKLHSWNAVFSPLLYVWRRWGSVSGGESSDLFTLPGWLNAGLRTVVGWDARLCSRMNVMWGSSLFAVCQKPVPSDRS
jgi:SAM-dependent methyltransferase